MHLFNREGSEDHAQLLSAETTEDDFDDQAGAESDDGHVIDNTFHEVFEVEDSVWPIPETAYGKAIFQLFAATTLQGAYLRGSGAYPVSAWWRVVSSFALLFLCMSIQYYLSSSIHNKISRENFGWLAYLDQCSHGIVMDVCPDEEEQVGPQCCTVDQVCGESEWVYTCTLGRWGGERNMPGATFNNMATCAMRELYDTYVRYEDATKGGWSWVLASALILWLCIVSQEMLNTTNMLRAFCGLPLIDRQRNQAVNLGKEVIIVGTTRCVFTILIIACVLPRFLLTLWIGWSGWIFLSYSTSIVDLVLDAIALGFIFEVDNVVYHGTTGPGMRRLIKAARPLTIPDTGGLAQRSLKFASYDVFIPIGIIMIVVAWVGVTYSLRMSRIADFIHQSCVIKPTLPS